MAGSPQFVQGVREAASALGMDPTDLATIISYETAGTFDPAKKGPTTQWGQHKGLIQFGEPQARAHGVDWNNPEASQLGADGAIVRYFRSSGWKPGMGMLDAYSIVNAGGPGLYNRSDANNGGAPGTVADKVRTQMGGHRKNAIRLLGGSGQPPQATVSTKGTAPMMQQKEQQPRGFLEGFGVQRRDETAGGETAQPFYQRDSFKDTAALLAQGFGRMGIMGMEEIADDIAKQRTENKAKNKTVEYLRKSGRGDLADAVAEGLLGGSDAAKMMFAKPDPVKGVAIGDRLINPSTGDVMADFSGGYDAEAVAKARKEFTGQQFVKDFTKQTSAYGRIISSVDDPSPSGDLALIFNFMKVLDPGSTVREGEFATAAQAGKVDDRVRNLYNRVLSGETLTAAQRADFAGRATGLYTGAESQYKALADQYAGFAEAAGLPVKQVIPDFSYAGSRYEKPLEMQLPPMPSNLPPGTTREEWAEAWANMSDEMRREILGR